MQGTRVQEAAPASPPCGTRSHVSLGSHHHAAVRAAPRAPPQGIRAAGSPVLLHILLMYFSHMHVLPSSFCRCLKGTTPSRHLIRTLLWISSQGHGAAGTADAGQHLKFIASSPQDGKGSCCLAAAACPKPSPRGPLSTAAGDVAESSRTATSLLCCRPIGDMFSPQLDSCSPVQFEPPPPPDFMLGLQSRHVLHLQSRQTALPWVSGSDGCFREKGQRGQGGLPPPTTCRDGAMLPKPVQSGASRSKSHVSGLCVPWDKADPPSLHFMLPTAAEIVHRSFSLSPQMQP